MRSRRTEGKKKVSDKRRQLERVERHENGMNNDLEESNKDFKDKKKGLKDHNKDNKNKDLKTVQLSAKE